MAQLTMNTYKNKTKTKKWKNIMIYCFDSVLTTDQATLKLLLCSVEWQKWIKTEA